jgi:hypothetical protein
VISKGNTSTDKNKTITTTYLPSNDSSYSPNYNTSDSTVISTDNTTTTTTKKFIVYPESPRGSSIITLINIYPNELSEFKIGNSITLNDGTVRTIIGIVINDDVETESIPEVFSNYSENFKEGLDGTSITLYLNEPTTSATTSVTVVKKVPISDITTSPPILNDTSPSLNSKVTPSDTDLTNISNEIENKLLNDIQNNKTKLVNDIVSGINKKINPANSYYEVNNNSNIPYFNNTSYQSESEYNKYIKQQNIPSSNSIVQPNTNNVFQSGNMQVRLPDRYLDNRSGQLPSISESKTQVVFPTSESGNPPHIYSYNGALQEKGSDFVASNTISETNRMLGRLDYVPPPLPPNLDFTYYGALRSKGIDVKPVNALQGPNPNNYSEKILDDNLYPALGGQISDEKLPQPNMNEVSMFSSNPIDLYSQFGALFPKNNYYNN